MRAVRATQDIGDRGDLDHEYDDEDDDVGGPGDPALHDGEQCDFGQQQAGRTYERPDGHGATAFAKTHAEVEDRRETEFVEGE